MSNPSPIKKILNWLIKRAENHKNNLLMLITGAGVFFVGVALIIWVNHAIPSSVEQELIALSGMIMCIIGSIVAFLGYLGLSILRLIKFFNDDINPPD